MTEPLVELRAGSRADTDAIAAEVAGLARPGDIIVLSGEMGAGKTAFAQGFGRALGVRGPITSPTFTLVRSHPVEHGPYAGKLTFHHADLYRLERTSEVADLALRELAEPDGIVLVEWGEVVDLFGDHLVVHLDPDVGDDLDLGRDVDGGGGGGADDHAALLDGRRRIELGAVGSSWAGRWQRLVDATRGFAC